MPQDNEYTFVDGTAIIWAVLSMLTFILGLIFAEAWGGLSQNIEIVGLLSTVFSLDATGIILASILFAVLYGLCAFLLWGRFIEAKIVVTGVSALLLFAFPIGTIIAVLTLIVMFGYKTRTEFTYSLGEE